MKITYYNKIQWIPVFQNEGRIKESRNGIIESGPPPFWPRKTCLSWTIFCGLRIEANVRAHHPPNMWVVTTCVLNLNANLLFRNDQTFKIFPMLMFQVCQWVLANKNVSLKF